MLISVKVAQPISFFFYQRMRSYWYLDNYKKEGEKALLALTGDSRNKMTPLCTFESVNLIMQNHALLSLYFCVIQK